ncbi:MAG: hypothetical protein KUG82_10275 [Pseudomonadales bacterium]|nr:hypothetical protein [Pseudomonadales bacterium]
MRRKSRTVIAESEWITVRTGVHPGRATPHGLNRVDREMLANVRYLHPTNEPVLLLDILL